MMISLVFLGGERSKYIKLGSGVFTFLAAPILHGLAV